MRSWPNQKGLRGERNTAGGWQSRKEAGKQSCATCIPVENGMHILLIGSCGERSFVHLHENSARVPSLVSSECHFLGGAHCWGSHHLSVGNPKSVLASRNLCSASGFMNNVPFPLSDTRPTESLVVMSFAHSSLCLRLQLVLGFGHGCSLKECRSFLHQPHALYHAVLLRLI